MEKFIFDNEKQFVRMDRLPIQRHPDDPDYQPSEQLPDTESQPLNDDGPTDNISIVTFEKPGENPKPIPQEGTKPQPSFLLDDQIAA